MLYRVRYYRADGIRERALIDLPSERDVQLWAKRSRINPAGLDVQPATTCPDCGTAGALTLHEVRKGYRCRECTAAAEFGA